MGRSEARRKTPLDLMRPEFSRMIDNARAPLALTPTQQLIGKTETFLQWCERLAAEGLKVDGNDVEAVRDSVAAATRRAGAGGGPVLVRAVTQRTNGASSVDPLVLARQNLIGAGISAGQLYEVERRARRLVAEAEAHAKAMFRAEEPAPIREPEAWPAAS